MRLFTGIALPEHMTNAIERLLDRLRPAAHITWTPVYNLHVTTKFIGQWPEDRLKEIIGALHTLGPMDYIPISIGGIGWFPNPHSPRVLWAGVQGGAPLSALAARTDEALETLGIQKEKRPYAPHLTLARIRDTAVPLASLRHAIAQHPPVEFGSFLADRFHLYESKPGPCGSIYTQLAEIPFVSR